MILNLTQHRATADQLKAGVVDLPAAQQMELVKLLTFETRPDKWELKNRARSIAAFAAESGIKMGVLEHVVCQGEKLIGGAVMIGGAPFLMAQLEHELHMIGVDVCYAFSTRESVESVNETGAVKKTAIFRHAGFVWTR